MTEPHAWASPGSAVPEPAAPRAPAQAEPPVAAEEPLEREIPLRPLAVAETLDGAVTYIRRNARTVLGISVVLTSAVQIVITVVQYFLIGAQARTEVTPALIAHSLGPLFLTAVGGQLLTAYVVLLLAGLLAPVMARTLLGHTVSLGAAWRDVKPVAGRLARAATGLTAIGVLTVGVPFMPLIVSVALGGPAPLSVLLMLGGVAVAVVLTIVAAVLLALTMPVLVLERRGVGAAMRRSADLVRGRWGNVFGILMLSGFFTFIVGGFVLPLPFAVAQRIMLAFDKEPGGWLLIAIIAVGTVGRILAGTLLNPFNAGVITLLYADRRMRNEAFDLELQMDRPDDPVAAWRPGPLTAAGSGRQPRTPQPPMLLPPPRPPRGWRR